MRNKAFKVLLVGTEEGVNKQGVRNEIQLAHSVGRRIGDPDFVIPLRLAARVRAALRRRAEPESFVSGKLSIRYDRRQVSVASQAVELTATEYELLRVLSLNAGRVVTRDTLLRQAWSGRDRGGSEPVRTFV